jgi:hypothetical protein
LVNSNINTMQTTYRLKAQEISTAFLKSLKTLFAGQEVEITVKSIEPQKKQSDSQRNGVLLQMIKDNRKTAPVIPQNLDIRGLIDDSHNPVSGN